jgi:hypothetical protein
MGMPVVSNAFELVEKKQVGSDGIETSTLRFENSGVSRGLTAAQQSRVQPVGASSSSHGTSFAMDVEAGLAVQGSVLDKKRLKILFEHAAEAIGSLSVAGSFYNGPTGPDHCIFSRPPNNKFDSNRQDQVSAIGRIIADDVITKVSQLPTCESDIETIKNLYEKHLKDAIGVSETTPAIASKIKNKATTLRWACAALGRSANMDTALWDLRSYAKSLVDGEESDGLFRE